MGKLTDVINKMGELPKPVTEAALAFGIFAIALGATLLLAAGVATALAPSPARVGLIALAVLGVGLATAAAWALWNTNFGSIQDKTASVLA